MQSYTAFVRDGLMHVCKVDLSAASLPHTFPTGLVIERNFQLSGGSGSVMLFDMCLLLLGFS